VDPSNRDKTRTPAFARLRQGEPAAPTPFFLTRREALGRLALLTGGAIVGAEAFLRGDSLAGTKPMPAFSDDDRALLDEIGETIIPTTNTPGAKAAAIGAFMITMVNDCYDAANHAIFQSGLSELEQASRHKFGSPFRAITPAQRTELLNGLDASHVPYFRRMKQLAILGYFTSEIGCTQALRYIETPGAYRSDPYQPGDRAWYESTKLPSI